jgi:Putative auto-transporter adhesin, head GIN domain
VRDGQRPGPATTEQRSVEGVRAVRLLTSGDLSLTAGDQAELTITAGRDVLPRLASTVEDGILVLGSEPGLSSSGEIRYSLSLPRIERLVVGGSGTARGDVVVTGPLAVEASGSGGIDLAGLAVSDLRVRISGLGDVHLTGHASTQIVSITGSGAYEGRDLTTQESTIEAGGSGSAWVSASQRLRADVAGSGDVAYTGSPSKVEPHTSGSGRILPGLVSQRLPPSGPHRTVAGRTRPAPERRHPAQPPVRLTNRTRMQRADGGAAPVSRWDVGYGPSGALWRVSVLGYRLSEPTRASTRCRLIAR